MTVYLVCERVDLGDNVVSVHASREGAEQVRQELVRKAVDYWASRGYAETGTRIAEGISIQSFEVEA